MSKLKIIIIILLSLSIMYISSCTGNNVDDNTVETAELPAEFSDEEGNMLFVNNSGSTLVLTVNGAPYRTIHDSPSDFIVKIPTKDRDTLIDMKLFKKEDLSPPYDFNNNAFKTWFTTLSPNSKSNPNKTWFVDKDEDDSNEIHMGEINFQYLPGDDPYYNVQIYINGRSGKRAATLDNSINSEKTIGLPFGAYNIAYQYIYSNPNSNEPPTFNWIESEIIGYDEVPIYVVLKSGRENPTKTIPHYQQLVEEPAVVKYGFLHIQNDLSIPVDVYARSVDLNIGNKDTKIEDVMYDDGRIKDSASLIEGKDSFKYTMMEGQWDIYVKDFSGNQIFYSKINIVDKKTSNANIIKQPDFVENVKDDIEFNNQIVSITVNSSVDDAGVYISSKSNAPGIMNKEEKLLGVTPYNSTISLEIDDLTYEKSSSVEVLITVKKDGYFELVKGFNVQGLLSSNELNTVFDLKKKDNNPSDVFPSIEGNADKDPVVTFKMEIKPDGESNYSEEKLIFNEETGFFHPGYKFKNEDLFRMYMKTNSNYSAYFINVTTDGRVLPLYPSDSGESTWIKRNSEKMFPPKGKDGTKYAYGFDGNFKRELFIVILGLDEINPDDINDAKIIDENKLNSIDSIRNSLFPNWEELQLKPSEGGKLAVYGIELFRDDE